MINKNININNNNNKSKRLQQLKQLKSFGSESEKSINDILSRLGWNSNDLIKSEEMVLCPLNSNHRMPEKSLDNHLEKCELRANGYNNEEIEKVVPSSAFYYEKSPHIRPVVIDKQIQEKILGIQKDVPLCNDRCRIELSAQQRLALYDDVILTSRTNSKCSDDSQRDDQSLKVDLFDALNKNSTHKETSNKLQMLAINRDMKRRRQSYRAKSVHIRGKSYSEILKNVIENHCQSLKSRLETKSEQNLTSSTSHSHKHKTQKHKSKHKHKHKHKSKDRHREHKHRKH